MANKGSVLSRRQSAPEVKEYRTTVTPEMAEEWLGKNALNRNLRETHVDNLKNAILRGEWVYNADPIRFDDKGNLIDGQHRLWAVVFAEQSIDVLVVENLPRETMLTIDVGLKRSLAGHLKIMGYPNSILLAAMINTKWKLDNGKIRSNQTPTFQQALHILKEHPGLAESVKVVSPWRRRLRGSSAVVGTLHYEFSTRDFDAAEAFFDGVINGVGLVEDDPRFALRRHVELSNPGSVAFAALVIKAWNYYLEGRSVSHLVWRPVGSRAESFPEIQGG